MSRKTSPYENENGTVVDVHKVTEETAGGLYVTGVGSQDAKPGELYARDSANSWTPVASLKGYKALETNVDDIPVRTTDSNSRTESEEESDDYDPSRYTVSNVNKYLDRVAESDPEEFDRVVAAERNGKARATILNRA